jgi:hypothetical protein
METHPYIQPFKGFGLVLTFLHEDPPWPKISFQGVCVSVSIPA